PRDSRDCFTQEGQAAGDLLLVASRLRSDRHAVGRPGQIQGRQRPTVLHTQRVGGKRVGQLGGRSDVAGVHLGRGYVLLTTRKKDLREALLTAAAEVRQVSIV